MSRNFECPKCKADIGDSYQGDDPDVGISAGYYCDTCDEGYSAEYESHDDDVQIFGVGGSVHLIHSHRCPKCLSTNLEMGYGMAGGGMGPYSYCPRCGIIVHKSQEVM